MSTTNALPTLAELLHTLTSGEAVPVADDVPWFEVGRICELDEEAYFYWLELLPPRWIRGNYFCFGEGTGPFRLFWQKRDRYFGRELSQEETELFATVARVSLHH